MSRLVCDFSPFRYQKYSVRDGHAKFVAPCERMKSNNHIQRKRPDGRFPVVVSINAIVTRGSLLVMQHDAARSCCSSRARFSSSGATSVPGRATPWPSEEDAPRRGTPVWIIYSGCIPGEEGGNFRGAVLRWLRSFIASSPSYHLLRSLPSSPPLAPPACYPPVPLPSPLSVRPHPSVAILHQNLFVPRREKRAAVRAATLSALICAQRERRKLMHVAHAGRESVGSLSSRTPALTRIHHRAAGSSDERRIVRSTGTRAVFFSRGILSMKF